jgi:hypothetical protein
MVIESAPAFRLIISLPAAPEAKVNTFITKIV